MATSATATLPELTQGYSGTHAGDAPSRDRASAEELHPGLPAPLPAGEHIVWQGAPRAARLARQIFHIRLVAAYFAILAVYRAADVLQDGRGIGDAAFGVLLVVGCGALVIGLFELLAWLSARTTVYTITNRRIVMSVGVALSKTVDIPFKEIESLHLQAGFDGVGNISIELKNGDVIPYFILWPHMRPWHLRHPQPMLRALPNAPEVAADLARRLAAVARAEEEAGEAGAAPTPSELERIAAQSAVTSEIRASERRAKIPLLACAGLVIMTLIAVSWVQLNQTASERVTAPAEVYQLSFTPLEADRFAVVDATRGETVTRVEPGRDGLVRNALRSLDRVRKLRGLPVDAPYQLVIWDTGRRTLSDLGTDRHIPLDSFGPTNFGALADLLKLGSGGT